MEIAFTSFVTEAIGNDTPVAIGVSGGKDSQAAALATIRHLNEVGHAGPRILVHSDLGIVEWAASIRVCRELAAHLGLELVELARQAGGLMERWRARWRSSMDRYKSLSTVTLVLPWSTPGMRFCTSELKAHLIRSYLKKRFPGQLVINVTGVRRDEGPDRRKGSIADIDDVARLINWRPLSDWAEPDVFACIAASGLLPHPAYSDYGMRRVSCVFCIFSTLADMHKALEQEETHDLYRAMVTLEAESGFAFQGDRWLGMVRPDLLGDGLLDRFKHARLVLSGERRKIEAQITKPMLYVKGWPTRMLTNEEADVLADARRRVSELYGWDDVQYLDRDSVHRRYADLMDLKLRKDAQKSATAERRALRISKAA